MLLGRSRKCPECGSEISADAQVCPECDKVISSMSPRKRKEMLFGCAIVGALIFMGLLGILMYSFFSDRLLGNPHK